ncbi:hypothetical protein [Winogradskyella sp. SYSU M77433]|uniref:hypothetical protein n=1 Tax=Winogradskyella sp. SYSU M77433 TaxID=3042722 RepID=UPI0024805F91|nr:hypothetical protein [Winogradskyella sp. SYSU M77433]MDH7912553.1 hypothetical protein [Winogradskyella sp. SYSU M77433]
MSKYKNDRAFTDYVHQKLALPLIYKPIDWQKVQLRRDYAKYIDMTDGIDYIFRKDNQIKTVQERFRESKYQEFSDFTIRYRRDENKIEDRQESEYYKMKAHYFTYGIIDASKSEVKSASDFLKFAIIDLQKVYQKLDSEDIIISDNNQNKCRIIDNARIECPVKYNPDGSSSFFPIDISFLVKLWGDDMLIAQKGFL